MSHPPATPHRQPAVSTASRSGTGRRALGSDPFETSVGSDPFLAGLAALGRAGEVERLEPGGNVSAAATAMGEETPVDDLAARFEAQAAPGPRPPGGDDRAGPLRQISGPGSERRWIATPPLADIELSEAEDWLDRILDPQHRRRLAALSHLVKGETPYDRFGLSPLVLKRTFPALYALYRLYFRVQSQGHENLPSSGPVVVAANHAGLLPFDGAMLVLDILLHSDPPRLARAIVDRWAGALPWVNVFFARVGQIIGTRENFADLLREGQLLLVFPEGLAGIRKLVTQRYRLQTFHVGFVEQALRQRAPVVPAAVIGSDDQAPILFDVRPVAKALGLPVAPITPTFPLLGPLGLLPYPVRYRIVYGEPLHFHERFDPEEADDPRLVRYLARQVRRAVQSLIDRHR